MAQKNRKKQDIFISMTPHDMTAHQSAPLQEVRRKHKSSFMNLTQSSWGEKPQPDCLTLDQPRGPEKRRQNNVNERRCHWLAHHPLVRYVYGPHMVTCRCGEDVERGPTNIVTAFKKHSIICPLYKDNKALQVDEHNGTYPCDIDWPGKGAFTKKKTSLTWRRRRRSQFNNKRCASSAAQDISMSALPEVLVPVSRMEIDEQQGRNLPAFPASWEPSSAEEDGYSSSAPSNLDHSSNERSGDSDSLAPAPPASLETPSDAQAAEELSLLARRRRTALNIAWLSGN